MQASKNKTPSSAARRSSRPRRSRLGDDGTDSEEDVRTPRSNHEAVTDNHEMVLAVSKTQVVDVMIHSPKGSSPVATETIWDQALEDIFDDADGDAGENEGMEEENASGNEGVEEENASGNEGVEEEKASGNEDEDVSGDDGVEEEDVEEMQESIDMIPDTQARNTSSPNIEDLDVSRESHTTRRLSSRSISTVKTPTSTVPPAVNVSDTGVNDLSIAARKLSNDRSASKTPVGATPSHTPKDTTSVKSRTSTSRLSRSGTPKDKSSVKTPSNKTLQGTPSRLSNSRDISTRSTRRMSIRTADDQAMSVSASGSGTRKTRSSLPDSVARQRHAVQERDNILSSTSLTPGNQSGKAVHSYSRVRTPKNLSNADRSSQHNVDMDFESIR